LTPILGGFSNLRLLAMRAERPTFEGEPHDF
jgi:hypothetical protein